MDKLEKHIKNQLKNREISPSAEAWDKIMGELEQEKSASPKSTYWWAIAAGIVGLLVLSIRFFSPQGSIETLRETTIVQGENNKGETLEDYKKSSVETNMEKSQKALPLEFPLDKQQDQGPKGIENIIQVAESEVPNNKEPLKDVEEVTDLAINDKLEKVLAQINSLESNAVVVSDREIDSLLMEAQRELLAEKTLVENGKVDAMALLNEVEMELYDDQRNPLFIKLKEGFFRLRTAVADRDN
ncbi:MAG: hypothetical protein AAGH81_11760 [Bacteroidota bacterium]